MNDMTIIDQIALIAQSARVECHRLLMWMCLSILAIGGAGVILYAARRIIARCRRFIMSIGPVGCMIVGPFAVALYVYGATKWRFEYANGVHDAGSYCTNDLICAAWIYDPIVGDYTLKAQYQDLTITNAVGECLDPFHPLDDANVEDCGHVWEVENATNMRVVVWAQYVPPPIVHTNGVYHLSGVMRTMDGVSAKFVTPGVLIAVNTETGERLIITPTNAPTSTPVIPHLQAPSQEEPQE